MADLISSIDVPSITYGTPKQAANGMRVPVHYNGAKLAVQLSTSTADRQTIIFGLDHPDRPGLSASDASRCSLSVSVPAEARRVLEGVDQANVAAAHGNCAAWFKKTLDCDSVRDMYTPIVKLPAQEGRSPSVRLKVNLDGSYATKIQVVVSHVGDNIEWRPGGEADLVRGAQCIAVVETTGLWFLNKKFGMAISATSLLVWPPSIADSIAVFVELAALWT